MNAGWFVDKYWRYYLEIEKQFSLTMRYVEAVPYNYYTYSIEYTQLLMTICSEIDVLGKVIAQYCDSSFDYNKSDIRKWGLIFQQNYSELQSKIVYFNERIEINPFKSWKYEVRQNRNGQNYMALSKSSKQLFWWKNYNEVKHSRVKINDGSNYKKANLKNVLYSLSALYIMEQFLLRNCFNGALLYKHEKIENSRLFMFDLEEVKYKKAL